MPKTKRRTPEENARVFAMHFEDASKEDIGNAWNTETADTIAAIRDMIDTYLNTNEDSEDIEDRRVYIENVLRDLQAMCALTEWVDASPYRAALDDLLGLAEDEGEKCQAILRQQGEKPPKGWLKLWRSCMKHIKDNFM